MHGIWRRIRAWLDLDLRDLFWITGLAAASYGAALVYAPAGWITCGVALFWMGVRR